MSISTSAPKLMAGVPTAYLSPRLPFPPNVDYNVSVGVELAPGLGVSLDGKALLVGPGGRLGRTEITGRLADGTYPQRDSVVLRSEGETAVDGFHDWQDYTLKGSAQSFSAAGQDELRGFSVASTEDGFRVSSPYSARSWTVKTTDEGVSVRSDFADGEQFLVTSEAGVTTIDSNFDNQDFTVTRNADGGAVIDGHLLPEDFSFSPTGNGYELTGYYPQQRFVIAFEG
jgi:hypothetical protein